MSLLQAIESESGGEPVPSEAIRGLPVSGEAIERLLEAGNLALEVGQIDVATAKFERARQAAEDAGEQTLADRAFCRLAYLRIERGEGGFVVPQLRRLLLRSSNPQVCYVAAYHVARAFELRRDFPKASYYARLAADWAGRAGSEVWAAAAHNLLGNCLLSRSRFPEALAEFETALDLARGAEAGWRLAIADGIGYCLLMTGRHRPALQLLYASLRAAIRLRSRYTGALHASICQALVEIGRPRPARRHGERALRLARARREAEGERIALMLLAQAHAQLGSAEAAQAALDELQERHYPGVPGLAAFFTALGPARWANLRG